MILHSRRHFTITLLLAVATPVRGDSVLPLADQIDKGIQLLDKIYLSPALGMWLDRPGDDLRGHWESRINPPWWSAANAVELLADYMNATKTSAYDGRLAKMYDLFVDRHRCWPVVAAELKKRGQWAEKDEEQLKKRMGRSFRFNNFCNEYLDDSGWWGIAWLKMAERTGDARYLATAKAVHAHMAAQWRAEGSGGVRWCLEEGRQRPNTITNTLFLILSARLALKTKEPSYREWATKTWHWLHDQKLYDGVGVIDGPRHRADWWSYNQGTYLGGLAEFIKLDPTTAEAKSSLAEMATVATSVLTKAGFVDEKGVILESRGTAGWDGALFKGIFARYLRQTADSLKMHMASPEVVEKIHAALAASRQAILGHAKGPDGQIMADWNATPKNTERNFNTHLSGLIGLTAGLP